MTLSDALKELAKITFLNPQLWKDMAIILIPFIVVYLLFIWHKTRHPGKDSNSAQ